MKPHTASTDNAPPHLLSVVIPVYNRRDLVLRAIESVLAQQTNLAREVIVVDDGSSDDTAATVREHFAADARVQVIAADHGGASAARNRGAHAAHGDWLCFLDSDDFWLPGLLATVEHVFAREPGLAFVCCEGATLATPAEPAQTRIVASGAPGWSHAQFRRVQLTRESCNLPSSKACLVLSGDFLPAIVFGDLFYLSGMIMRRESFLAAGPFNERFRFFNDWEFFSRLCLSGHGAYVDDDGFRRDTGRADQISRRRPLTAMPRRQLYLVRTLLRRAEAQRHGRVLRIALADACYALGRALVRCHQHRRARAYLLLSLRERYKIFRSLLLLLRLAR